MHKKIIGFTIALALFVVAVPVPTFAAGLTESQKSAVIGLLRAFGAEQSVINNVARTLGGVSPYVDDIPNTGGISCVELSYNLFSGSTDNATGGQVTKLQRFLNVSQTGYFGPETEIAVQKWQAQNGIVSSGSPDTTGYGYVGPKTRAMMAKGCGKVVPPMSDAISVRVEVPNQLTETAKAGSGDMFLIRWVTKNAPSNARVCTSFVSEQTGKIFNFPSDKSCSPARNGDDFLAAPLIRTAGYDLGPGTYKMHVIIVGPATDGKDGPVLAEDYSDYPFTLIENQNKAAIIDQSSLTVRTDKDYARVTLTGSASNVSRIGIGIKGYDGSYVRVVNGRWSATLGEALPTGTYTVQITNEDDNTVLTTGTLVIRANVVVNKTVKEIDWHVEAANPSITDSNDYKKYEQTISIGVGFADGTSTSYYVGKSYGCTAYNGRQPADASNVLGRVSCYFAASSVDFVAYNQNGRFIVERQDVSAKDGSVKKTIVLEI